MIDLDDSICLETLEACNIEELKRMLCVGPKLSWMDPIFHYLRIGTLFDDNLIACKVKRQAPYYVLLDDKFYKRSYSLPLLKCLLQFEVDYTMREVLEGICGNHLGGRPWHTKYFDKDTTGWLGELLSSSLPL